MSGYHVDWKINKKKNIEIQPVIHEAEDIAIEQSNFTEVADEEFSLTKPVLLNISSKKTNKEVATKTFERQYVQNELSDNLI